MSLQSCVTIKKEWDIVGARQIGRDIAKKTGFGTVDQARIATAVSELARNIYLYAGSGYVYFEIMNNVNQSGISITAVDEGPGIDNVGQIMEDGYTTSGGLGAGLPGVKRLMDVFNIDSDGKKGTEIKAIKWAR